MKDNPLASVCWAAFVTTALGLSASLGQTADPPVSPNAPSELSLIDNIKRLSEVQAGHLATPQQLVAAATVQKQVVDSVDALLARYPKTSFKEDALIIKLGALADLARGHPAHLRQLLALTDRLTGEGGTGRLASENAFYAIQAFVLAARYEEMPEQRRLLGTRERYEAFLADYPKSQRVPVIRASLIRNLIALGKTDNAQKEFSRLQHEYPDHKATRRAQGELYRATAIGKPFAFSYTKPDGKVVRTTDYEGKVLIIHFWAGWSRASMDQLPQLIELHEECKDRGLQLVGVNVDRDPRQMDSALREHDMPWPQYFDYKGFENDILVAQGVIRIPTCFIVDRKGVLRSIDPGDRLREVVDGLLAE